MQRFLRTLVYATYPFLFWSVLLVFNGIGFGRAFIADFTIANHTNQTIVVTPVGTIDREGHRALLPITISPSVNLPALRSKAFRLAPGELVTISYDMDDIKFSEIVVEDQQFQLYQFIVDPNPTANQFHGLEQDYVIENLTHLEPADPDVRNAALTAQSSSRRIGSFYTILLGSLVAYLLFNLALRACPAQGTSPVPSRTPRA